MRPSNEAGYAPPRERAVATSWVRTAFVAILISLIAAASVIQLNANVTRYHERSEVLTAREQELVDLRSAAWQAIWTGIEAAASGDGRLAATSLDGFRARLAEVEAADPLTAAPDVEQLRATFVRDQRGVLTLLEAGSAADARAAMVRTEEGFVWMRTELGVERVLATRNQQRFRALSTWGTVAAVFLAAGFVGLLSWYGERVRRKAADATATELREMAFVDPLTDLPNRVAFLSGLNDALNDASETTGALAVLFIDIDNFKSVNDTMGHAAGDELITQVARRIRSAVRPADVCARLGGDEFAIIVEHMKDLEDSTLVAERILAAMDQPFYVDGRELNVHCSIGVAISEHGVEGADELTRNADVAMYVAKSRGKARFEIYEPAMHPDLVEQRELLDDLTGALEREELVLYYQPLIDMPTEGVVGAEALIRWNHPTRRLVPPSKFIPIAEESGLIVPIGRWVLEEACRQGALWRIRFPGHRGFTMAVNISARQLAQPSFIEDVRATLHGFHTDPASLTLELTESMMLADDEVTALTIREIRELGVRVAIDDFGTGYSSLAYLQQFPVDVIKIDRSFTERLSADGRNFEVTRSIVELGRSLNLEIVAEGIEHAGQVAAIRSLGCTHGQGYYYGRPMPAAEFTKLISRAIFAPTSRAA
jgi:diguanylate cyclase (GGDEF)-like protein